MARARTKPTAGAASRRRAQLSHPPGSYFASGAEKESLEFTSTGCGVLDEALGGGPVLGRVINVVGDKSSGKTLLGMETMAQTLHRYPTAWARYAESESAWDGPYAEALGIPIGRITLNRPGTRIATIEEWYEDMKRCMTMDAHKGKPGVYVVDSLDAMSDAAEMDGEFDEASFKGTKPKKIGELFRREIDNIQAARMLLIIISQLRDKIGVTYGDTKTRSGGKALDFYASQILWLREIDKIKRTSSGIERVTGLNVEGYVKKNKIGLPFRKARYPLLFGYGIDDFTATVEWLIDAGAVNRLKDLGMRKKAATRARTRSQLAAAPADEPTDPGLKPYPEVIEAIRNEGGARAKELREALSTILREEWQRVEMMTLPKAKKYE